MTRIFEQNGADDVEGGDHGVQHGDRVLQTDVVQRRHDGVTRQDHHLDQTQHDARLLGAAEARDHGEKDHYV